MRFEASCEATDKCLVFGLFIASRLSLLPQNPSFRGILRSSETECRCTASLLIEIGLHNREGYRDEDKQYHCLQIKAQNSSCAIGSVVLAHDVQTIAA